MAKQESNKRVTAIVPAYNEAKRIGQVLDVLTTYPNFREIIVVDDGSTDNTETVVKQYNVRYVKNPINKGKGYSMDLGVKLAQDDVIFFVDADVSGLTHQIIDKIINPVLTGEVEMFIGMRNRKIYYLSYIIVFIPLLGGERALTKRLWQRLPNYYKYYFRVEAGLNFYAKYYGQGFKFKIFKGLSQVIKEKKYGFFQGLKQRWQLFFNIISAQLKLQFIDIPKTVRNRRLVIVNFLQSLLGVFLGFSVLAIAYVGPRNFIYKIFAEELNEDSSAPFVHFLLYLAGITSVNIIIIIGILIFIFNLIIFLLILKKLPHLFNGSLLQSITDKVLKRKVRSKTYIDRGNY